MAYVLYVIMIIIMMLILVLMYQIYACIKYNNSVLLDRCFFALYYRHHLTSFGNTSSSHKFKHRDVPSTPCSFESSCFGRVQHSQVWRQIIRLWLVQRSGKIYNPINNRLLRYIFFHKKNCMIYDMAGHWSHES